MTGIAGRWVTANTPFLTSPDCELRPDWNARICPGPYLKLIVEGGGTAVAVTPVDVVRDGEARERFVGDGTSTSRIAMSVMPGHAYALTLGQQPMGLTVRVQEGRPGEWVLVSVNAASPPLNIVSNSGPLLDVQSAAVVAAGTGGTYAYDAVEGRIYFKVVVSNVAQYVQGGVTIRLTP